MKRWLGLIVGAICLSACAATTPQATTANVSLSNQDAMKFERDRQAILAMAGDFDVTFDFRETVAFKDGYKPKEAYVTKATEIVRVIEDRGNFISLQHILLAGKQSEIPIKHWRQDWSFEPTSITRFIGGNGWKVEQVAPETAKGKWAQFVYQVDDGPRYAGLGTWQYDNGNPEWASAPSWRPLPRRDATKRTDYHAIEAVNRHAITPNGWVHEQDNTKLILDGIKASALVREVGINTYARSNNIKSKAAIDYWQKTETFWQAVRAEWTKYETETSEFGLTVQGEPEEIYMQILGTAAGIVDGSLTTSEAITQAQDTIQEYVETKLEPLKTRLAGG